MSKPTTSQIKSWAIHMVKRLETTVWTRKKLKIALKTLAEDNLVLVERLEDHGTTIIDEAGFGFWNRKLTYSEVKALWEAKGQVYEDLIKESRERHER